MRSRPWSPRSPRAKVQAARKRRDARDAEGRSFVEELQSRLPGWLVMWSPYRGRFQAFAMFTPLPVVVDEPTKDALLRGVHAVYAALRNGQTPPYVLVPKVPPGVVPARTDAGTVAA